MTTRERLQELIGELPEEDLPVLERVVRGLLAAPEDPLLAFLASCPESEEEETEEERAAVAQAWEEYRRGEAIPHEELIRRRKAKAA